MDLFLTIVAYEAGRLMQRRRMYLARVLTVMLGGGILLGVYAVAAMSQTQAMSVVICKWLGGMILVLSAYVAPYAAASAMLRERDSAAWDLLRLTGFSVPGLVLARFVISASVAVVGVLPLAPLLFLGLSFGGIEPGQLGWFAAVQIGTILEGTGVGLVLGAALSSRVRLHGVLLSGVLALFVGVPLALQRAAATVAPELAVVAELVSPLDVWRWIADARPVDPLWNRLAVDGTVALAGWLLAVWLLPRHLRATVVHERQRPWFRPTLPPIIGNPLVWKDLHVALGGPGRLAWRFARVVVGLLLLCLLPALLLDLSWGVYAQIGAVMVLAYCTLSVVLLYITRAAQSFQDERQAGTLPLLLSSDLRPSEILYGKALALYLGLVPEYLGIVATLALMLFLNPVLAAAFSVGTVVALIAVLLFWYPFSGFVLWLAVRLGRYVEIGTLVGGLTMLVVGPPLVIALTMLGLALAGPFGLVPLVALPLGFGFLFRHLAVRHLRRLAANPTGYLEG